MEIHIKKDGAIQSVTWHLELLIIIIIYSYIIQQVMEDDDKFTCGNLAPRKGAIIVGDAVVEIDTSLDESSGRVLAIGV